jgi:hypothetical protein
LPKNKNQDHLEFLRYKYQASKPKTALGNHAAISELKFPFIENTAENLLIKIYKTHIITPMAR